ncbi:DNA-3-methyladenine glycosylase 2 family protein [Fulvivirga sp. 29W222]|uniref:DNA-3-methyladenine glycosylase II n=1 Tax=Fulvivirga marina TaxID=2494733 RepID=A0A937G2S2_9BACT|nr:DNA-3-methyladenine glycosylase [Fulvivirga marina]MBL6447386.1 DNA-3-methyladenine glycosylase 2 family protein [Fulvivirga marina]
MQIEIPLPEHFSYQECLWYLDRGLDECLYRIENEIVYKAVSFNDKKALIKISASPQALQVNTLTQSSSIPDEAIVNYVNTWFDLGRDLSDFYTLAANDPLLSQLLAKYSGLRLIGINDLFEALCWSVIGQQINLKFAYKLKRALVERFGSYQDFGGQRYYYFPSPAELSAVTKQDLLAIQFSRQKADYVLNLAEMFDAGRISKSHLQQLSFRDALAELSKLHGIGAWTANYVSMRCLRFVEAFPMGDAGLQNAIRSLWGQKEKPTALQLRELSDQWAGWQAYATLYLWRSLSER